MAKKQPDLPTMEKPVIKSVEDAAEDYVGVRDKRMRLTEQECEKRTILIHEMKKAKLTSYTFDGQVVLLDTKDAVKVRTLKDDDGEGE